MLEEVVAEHNHPQATRMCLIAAASYNVSLACMYGTFSVLLGAMEARYGIARDVSSLGFALTITGIAVSSPVVGGLTTRFSLRSLMLVGALMEACAYLILATSHNVVLSLTTYVVLIGPGLTLTALVVPATVVGRWYKVNRGRALGLVFTPVGMAIMPVASSIILTRFGLPATYTVLAGLSLLVMIPILFVRDGPEIVKSSVLDTQPAAPASSWTTRSLLKSPSFWKLALAYAAISMVSTIFSSFFIPMAFGWGIDATRAASLLSVVSLAGMLGTVVSGILADRFGGSRVMAVLCFNVAAIWTLVLLHPPFALLVPLLAVLGMSSTATGVFSMALSEFFGKDGFGRAVGLGSTVSLPLSILCVPVAARISMNTGSFDSVIIGLIGILLVAAALVATMKSARRPEVAIAPTTGHS